MRRLTANPDSRIRSSELFLPSETATGRSPKGVEGLVRFPVLLIVFVLTFVAILVFSFRDGGPEKWFAWAQQASKDLVSSVSLKSGLVVQELAVSGARVLDSKFLLDETGVAIGVPMILVDLHDALEGVNRIDWVESAQISRHWPNKISIKVIEKNPVAIWETPEGPLFIDAKGKSFGGKHMGQFPRLPVLRGVGAGQRFPELVRVLEVVPIIGAEVVAAELVGKRRWDITMSGGLIVRLPEEEMETAWSSFADHMERSYLPLEGLAVADYTLRDRLVLQFDEVVVKQSGESLVSLRPLGGGSKESYTPGSYNFGSLGPG